MTRDPVADFIASGVDGSVSLPSPAALLDAYTRDLDRVRDMSHGLDVDRALRDAGFRQMPLHMGDEVAFEGRDESFRVAAHSVEGDGHVGQGRAHGAESDQRRSVGLAQFQRILHRSLLFVAVMTAFLHLLRKGDAR